MKRLILGVALCSAACGGNSPTGPSTPPSTTPPTTNPPPIVSNIAITPCPSSVVGFDLGFYQQLGCAALDGQMLPVRRWTQAPRLYVRTIDEAGAPIDALTLDTVQNAMVSTAALLTGGKFGLASVERGTSTREGTSGYITVKWGTATDRCGFSQVAVDGGTIQFNPQRATCACNGSKIFARSAAHELGHAFGYFHTDQQGDLMYGQTPLTCEPSISAREQQAMAYQYR